MEASGSPSLVLVEPHEVLRDGLAMLLEKTAEIGCHGELLRRRLSERRGGPRTDDFFDGGGSR